MPGKSNSSSNRATAIFHGPRYPALYQPEASARETSDGRRERPTDPTAVPTPVLPSFPASIIPHSGFWVPFQRNYKTHFGFRMFRHSLNVVKKWVRNGYGIQKIPSLSPTGSSEPPDAAPPGTPRSADKRCDRPRCRHCQPTCRYRSSVNPPCVQNSRQFAYSGNLTGSH